MSEQLGNIILGQGEIESAVKAVHEKILSECKNNAELENLYFGCQIYFSNWVESPDIMFIGMNPGNGYYRSEGEIVEEFEPLPRLDYLDGSYDLAEETKKLFSKMGKENLLETAFKTNAFFFATRKSADITRFFCLVSKELQDEIKRKSKEWIIELIKNIKPKNIIFEGFEAFKTMQALYQITFNVISQNEYFIHAKLDDITVMCYKRSFSNIPNIDKVAESINAISG
jgi:uracil-DNA glycosylase